MAQEMDLVKNNTIKRYAKQVLEIKISKTACNELRIRSNDFLKTALKEGQQNAKDSRRSTIMPRDIESAIEKSLGKKRLTWEETFEEIKYLNPIELGNLSKAITKYIEKGK